MQNDEHDDLADAMAFALLQKERSFKFDPVAEVIMTILLVALIIAILFMASCF